MIIFDLKKKNFRIVKKVYFKGGCFSHYLRTD